VIKASLMQRRKNMKKIIITLLALMLVSTVFIGCGEPYRTVTIAAPELQVNLTVTYEIDGVTRTLVMGENQVKDGVEVEIFFTLDPHYFAYLYINNTRQELVTPKLHTITQDTTIEIRVERQ